ncbi:hypothetical protein [Intrasporangium sp. YIM S08009]|uniref:hypothetical protein n=1 Tax=Intrasporangium zincisolvens TaxID=3080018 RepID=UPI002B060EFB|nr:hypothetical protein [Intrasporangium sp. YIM S08009]
MRDVLALLAILLGAAGILAAVVRSVSARGTSAPVPGARPRPGALHGVLAVAGVAFLVLGVGVVVAPDTGPMAVRSAPAPAHSRGRQPTPIPTPFDTSPAGAYRRLVDAYCAGIGVVLMTPADASRTSIHSALRASAASFEDLADVLDGVDPPPRLLNRHHRLVTAVRRTDRILTDADAQLNAGAMASFARQLDQLGRSVTELDRQARGLQLPHCRPA